MHAIEELFQRAEHRFCLIHLFDNFKLRYKKHDLRQQFWAIASSTNVWDFKRAMENLERANPKDRMKLIAAT